MRRLVEQTMRRTTRHKVVRQQSYSDRLIDLMRGYVNQHLTSAQIIEELVAMAKDVAADAGRGGQFSPALSEAELAFYDAVASNESAVAEMGGGVLASIARDLVATIRRSISVDWVARDDVRATLRTIIKGLLAKYNFPARRGSEGDRAGHPPDGDVR
jgi:type I restriction enzyme R subunit